MLFSLLFICLAIFKRSCENIYCSSLLLPRTLSQIWKLSDIILFKRIKEEKAHFGAKFECLSKSKIFWKEWIWGSIIGIFKVHHGVFFQAPVAVQGKKMQNKNEDTMISGTVETGGWLRWHYKQQTCGVAAWCSVRWDAAVVWRAGDASSANTLE